MNAALLRSMLGPDSAAWTFPWWSTRMRSLGWIKEKCLPCRALERTGHDDIFSKLTKGFTQKQSGRMLSWRHMRSEG